MESILSIYANNTHGYVAVKEEGQTFTRYVAWTPQQTQAAGFVPLLHDLLQESHKVPNVIITSRGPFAFTTLRITIAIAKSIAFCYPHARIFAPSNFQIFAFAARQSIQQGHNFLVLLDAFKMGFYAAVMLWEKGELSARFLEPPCFVPAQNIPAFLMAFQNCPVITDFTEQSFGNKFLKPWPPTLIIRPEANFALEQMNLYHTDPLLQQDELAHQFTPQYLHLPYYTKTPRPIYPI